MTIRPDQDSTACQVAATDNDLRGTQKVHDRNRSGDSLHGEERSHTKHGGTALAVKSNTTQKKWDITIIYRFQKQHRRIKRLTFFQRSRIFLAFQQRASASSQGNQSWGFPGHSCWTFHESCLQNVQHSLLLRCKWGPRWHQTRRALQ